MIRRKWLLLVVMCVLPLSLFAGNNGGETTGDAVDLIWIMGNPGQVPIDQAVVEEVLNEITVEKVGARVTTLYYDNDRTQLALNSGEDWDMAFTCEWFNNFAVQARAGYYADLTEAVQQDAPELYKTMPAIVWEGAKIDGKILAIPVKKDYAAEMFWRLDKELFVDKLGMDVPEYPASMGFLEIEKFLKAGKKAFDDGVLGPEGQYAMHLTKSGFHAASEFDNINREALLAIPYSAVGTKDANKIVVWPEHEDALEWLRALHKWYNAGYINRDAATMEDAPTYSAVKYGQGFYGADAIWSGRDGYAQAIVRYSGPYLSTASIRGSMNSISIDSNHVEIALKYQELVNTNQEYRDILRYGVEGTHWDRTADGLVKRNDTGRQRYVPWPFSQGSYSLSSVEAAEGIDVDPHMWKVIFDGYKDLLATNTIGFSFDIGSVETQVAAVKVIWDKYESVLETGTVDPDQEVPKMMKELEAAGIRKIQAEAQKQYDTFLAGK